MDWFALFVAATMLFAVSGVISFARSHSDQWQARLLVWLAVPFLTVSILYFYASITFPEIEGMRFLARWGFILIGLLTGLILHITAYIQRGQNGKRN